jgi:membrane protease YdiL (CAAX protease family)
MMAAQEHPTPRSAWPLSAGVTAALALFYLAGGVILLLQVGPWEAFREVVVNGTLVAAWLVVAHHILGREGARPLPALRRPKLELLWGLLLLTLVVAVVTVGYGGWVSLPRRSHVVIIYGGVALLFFGLRYPPATWGLRWPSRRGWLALAAVVLLNVAAGVVRALLLPAGEQQGTVGVDLADQLTSGPAVLSLLVSLLVGAALPEELLLRVTLQPRLAHYTGISWAIFLQAFLFALGHVPQKLLGNEHSLLVTIAYTLLLSNGLIAGYLWHRERSLLLLVLLHLFAFARFG